MPHLQDCSALSERCSPDQPRGLVVKNGTRCEADASRVCCRAELGPADDGTGTALPKVKRGSNMCCGQAVALRSMSSQGFALQSLPGHLYTQTLSCPTCQKAQKSKGCALWQLATSTLNLTDRRDSKGLCVIPASKDWISQAASPSGHGCLTEGNTQPLSKPGQGHYPAWHCCCPLPVRCHLPLFYTTI